MDFRWFQTLLNVYNWNRKPPPFDIYFRAALKTWKLAACDSLRQQQVGVALWLRALKAKRSASKALRTFFRHMRLQFSICGAHAATFAGCCSIFALVPRQLNCINLGKGNIFCFADPPWKTDQNHSQPHHHVMHQVKPSHNHPSHLQPPLAS